MSLSEGRQDRERLRERTRNQIKKSEVTRLRQLSCAPKRLRLRHLIVASCCHDHGSLSQSACSFLVNHHLSPHMRRPSQRTRPRLLSVIQIPRPGYDASTLSEEIRPRP